jgi:hypothetical protein
MYDQFTTLNFSAELEITVQLLVQIDKLVQLIESPVFTCTLLNLLSAIYHELNSFVSITASVIGT